MTNSTIPQEPSLFAPLHAEISELDKLCNTLADILNRTAVAVRGPGRHGWHDLPERAAEAIAAAAAAERERWIAKVGKTYREAHARFDDYSNPANKSVHDCIEWHLFNLRHDEIGGLKP